VLKGIDFSLLSPHDKLLADVTFGDYL